VLIAFLPLLIYGVINVVSPRTTTAWQVRATARHRASDPRAIVGTAFQGWIGIDPLETPSRITLRRVRVLGIVEIVVGIAIIVGAFAIFS
jgi:hypothetical protein